MGIPDWRYLIGFRQGDFLPPANEVVEKIMFLHLSVILFTGGGGVYPSMEWGRGMYPSMEWGRGCLPLGPGGVHPPWQTPSRQIPPVQTPTTPGRHPPPKMTIEVSDTHPTGMHSFYLFNKSSVLVWKISS